MTKDQPMETGKDVLHAFNQVTNDEGEVVELSTHQHEEAPLFERLPPHKKADPAKRARQKRAKQSRKKNR